MTLLDKADCPNCGRPAKIKHCKSPQCGWYFCHCEKTKEYTGLVFDLRNHQYLART